MLRDSKHSKPSFSSYSADFPCLGVAKVPRCRDLAIFFVDNDSYLSLAHARGITRALSRDGVKSRGEMATSRFSLSIKCLSS